MTVELPVEGLLGDQFARELPELSVPWRAAEAPRPELLVLNEPLARDVGLDPELLRGTAGLGLLLGTAPPAGSHPVAQIYAGHQFGGYSPRLGDGRALLLGELTDARGRRHDLHLKGSGPTPLARADGYAVVGPMLREYLVSEAMHALGVPTTRALAVVATGRQVRRDAEMMPGAVLARIAGSHLRVGSFEYARYASDPGLLRRLTEHALSRHFPGLLGADEPARELLGAVVEAQAALVAQWMLLGFVHGVMNTDNTTISGETIDYGPCAFLDGYDPAAVFSSIDQQGRYAYGKQPEIALWNLTRFAESLLPMLGDTQEAAIAAAESELSRFAAAYDRHWVAGMRAKLGLAAEVPVAEVAALAGRLLGVMAEHRLDFTGTFRSLARAARGGPAELAEPQLVLDVWVDDWLRHVPDANAMDRVNPVYIPRNHLVDEALVAANEGDLSLFTQLLEAVSHPFDERPDRARFALPAPLDLPPHRTYCGT